MSAPNRPIRTAWPSVLPRCPGAPWRGRASRPVALVVHHTGCGMRLVGFRGAHGELRLPAGRTGHHASCHDTDAEEGAY